MGSVGLWVCLLEALAADPVHEHDRARAEVKNVTCATPPIYSLLMDQIWGCNQDATQSNSLWKQRKTKEEEGRGVRNPILRVSHSQKERVYILSRKHMLPPHRGVYSA